MEVALIHVLAVVKAHWIECGGDWLECHVIHVVTVADIDHTVLDDEWDMHGEAKGECSEYLEQEISPATPANPDTVNAMESSQSEEEDDLIEDDAVQVLPVDCHENHDVVGSANHGVPQGIEPVQDELSCVPTRLIG